jgi:hypothetical protein
MSYVLHTSDGRKKGIFISFIAAPAPAQNFSAKIARGKLEFTLAQNSIDKKETRAKKSEFKPPN